MASPAGAHLGVYASFRELASTSIFISDFETNNFLFWTQQKRITRLAECALWGIHPT
jgi:hypothetical protein